MTTKLDDILFGRNIAHRLTHSMGYDWLQSLSGYVQLHESGVAALLLEVQKLSEQFKDGGVVADYDNEALPFSGELGSAHRFHRMLVDTICGAVPGFNAVGVYHEKPSLDPSLVLTVYGAVADRLPLANRAHLIDADVQAGKLAVFGEHRSPLKKLSDRIVKAVSPKSETPYVGIDDVAAIALETVKTYTQMVDVGELEISNDRGMAIFKTMSQLKVALDVHTDPDFWELTNEPILNAFDTIMENFQKTVVARLPTTAAPTEIRM
ncbi:hypothetical protein O9X98_07295 [Agrobacterium salinitolerans]|nr:hypothetical protein [Agrobacterium salinitolerans]